MTIEKNREKEKKWCFEVIPSKPLERGLTQHIDNAPFPLILSISPLHSQPLDLQDRSQLLHYILFNLPDRSHRLTMMRQTG